MRQGPAFLVFFVGLGAWAGAPALAAQQLEWGILADYQLVGYLSSPDGLEALGRNQAMFRSDAELRIGRWGRAFAEIEARADHAVTDRNRLYVREAYADLFLGPLDVRVGRAVHPWGRADQVNPTDYFGAWDYTDLLDAPEEPLGQTALQLRWYRGAGSVEVVVAPRFRASLLPAAGTRWWPDFPDSVRVPGTGTSPDVLVPAEFAYGPVSWPGGAGRLAYGVRISGAVRGWDLSVAAYEGPSDLPAYAVETEFDPATGRVSARLDRPYYRLRSLGADFATVMSGVGVHGEGAWYRPADDPRIPAGERLDWVHWVLGADYGLSGAVGERDLFVLLEWSRMAWPFDEYEPEPLDLAYVFRNALLARAELARVGFGGWEMESAWDLAEGGWLMRFARSWHPARGLRLEARADLLGGAEHSLLGTYARNRRLHVRLTYER